MNPCASPRCAVLCALFVSLSAALCLAAPAPKSVKPPVPERPKIKGCYIFHWKGEPCLAMFYRGGTFSFRYRKELYRGSWKLEGDVFTFDEVRDRVASERPSDAKSPPESPVRYVVRFKPGTLEGTTPDGTLKCKLVPRPDILKQREAESAAILKRNEERNKALREAQQRKAAQPKAP